MRTSILSIGLCLIALLSGHAQSQYKISFGHDSAGNQTLRDRVCTNCGSPAKVADPAMVAAIIADQKGPSEDDLGEPGGSKIVAYPNPVTDILTLTWRDNHKRVARVTLFSGIGRQLYQKDINAGQGSMALDLSGHSSGRYVVSVLYSDRSRQALHIIKK